MVKESKAHLILKKKAKSLLRKKGFKEKEIYLEYCFRFPNKHYRIDCAGIKQNFSIAIECGIVQKKKMEELNKVFDEVIHLEYSEKIKMIVVTKEFWLFIKNKKRKYEIFEDTIRRLAGYKQRKVNK